MLLDYKLNKKLTPIGDELYRDVIRYLTQFSEVKITAKRMTDIKRCCYCIILNTSYMVSRGRPYITLTLDQTSYSNPAIYNGNNTGRKISYTNMKIVLSYLENCTTSTIEVGGATDFELEYDSTKGKFAMIPKKFETSKLYLCESILSKVAEVTEPHSVKGSVLEVRDNKGRPVGIRLSEKEKNLIKILNAFNVSLDKGKINVQDDRFYVSVRKVYNNSSLKEGGRIFMTGANINELMSRDNRRQIVINDIPTVEIDYSQLWPRIAADLLGQDLAPDFDVYGVEIEGYCKKTMRDLCKVGLMCLFNADSFEAAYYATLGELKSSGMQKRIEEAKSRGEWQDFPIIRKMLDMLMDRNAYLIDYFFAKKATFLMNVESSLMDYILERAVEDDRILIPIHDSVVVQEDYADIAESNMYKAYEVVVGGNNCVVRRK